MKKQNIMKTEYWGFDLDDTLHNFTKASTLACQKIFQIIHQERSIAIQELEDCYKVILRESTKTAFVDGKTSKEYPQR